MDEQLLKESPKPESWWAGCLPRIASIAVAAPLLIWLVVS